MWELAFYFQFVPNNYNQSPNHFHSCIAAVGGTTVVIHGGLVVVGLQSYVTKLV